MTAITAHPMLRVVYSAALLRPRLADHGYAASIAYIRSRGGSCCGVACNRCPFFIQGIVPSFSGHWCLATMVPQGVVPATVHARYRRNILTLLEGQ